VGDEINLDVPSGTITMKILELKWAPPQYDRILLEKVKVDYEIESEEALSADFSIEPSPNINLGDVVTLDPSLSSGDILLYHWDFGDGETEPPTSFPDKIKHLYKSSGTFTIKLKVSTADGNSKSLAKTVNVNSKYANSILINYLVYKDITLVDYTFNAIYTKYAPINVRIEKYSNSNGLPVVVVGNAIKNQPLDYITVNKICEEIAVQGVLYLIKKAGYSVTGIGGILNLISVVDFIDFIQGYNFIEFDVTNDNGDLTVYLPYESARFDKTEHIGDQTPMGEDSINNKINKQISTPDNLQFQKTPEQLIYVGKPDIGLSEDTNQKFAYMKKIDPSALPDGITFYYEPRIQKKETVISPLPKLKITVKREIYRHSPVLKPKHLKDVPLIGVPIRVDGKDIGSTSSGGVLEVTEADLNKFSISPFGSHSLEAGDGTFYSKKTVQFDFTNERTTYVNIVLDKCKLPDTPSYVTIINENPSNYPDLVTYPHAKSIKNFISNKGILAEDLHVYMDDRTTKSIISGSDWVVVLCHSENIDKDYKLYSPGGYLFSVDTSPKDDLSSGSRWQIIRYYNKSVDTGDIFQHVYYIVYSEDKTEIVETAVKEFLKIIGEELGGSDGLDQLISTPIETSPDPQSTNFGTVLEDRTRTWGL
jgi:PKD repeat protein